jgi:hypothetical protein
MRRLHRRQEGDLGDLTYRQALERVANVCGGELEQPIQREL